MCVRTAKRRWKSLSGEEIVYYSKYLCALSTLGPIVCVLFVLVSSRGRERESVWTEPDKHGDTMEYGMISSITNILSPVE